MISQNQQQDYKVICKEVNPSEVSLTIINNYTLATYHTPQCILDKITPNTISLALSKFNPQISYSIKQAQHQLSFSIIVQIEYLPKISQTFLLALVPPEEGQSKVILVQIGQDIEQLNRRLKDLYKQSQAIIRQIDGKMKNPQKQTLEKGYYLLQFSGLFTVQQNQDLHDHGGCYHGDENQNESECYVRYSIVIQIVVTSTKQDKQKCNKKSFTVMANQYIYEYPFGIICPLDIPQSSTLQISIKDDKIYITNGILSISKARKYE